MRGSVVIFRNEKRCVTIKVWETLVIFSYSLALEASKLDQQYVHSRSAQDKLTVRHLVTVFFVIKPTRCTNFTNLFCHEILYVSDSSSVHRQEFIQDQYGSGFQSVPSWSCSKAVYKPVWHIPLLSVQWINSWWWTEELSETCRVSWQNKFVKLVHLVGFITKKFVTMHGHMNVKFVYSIHTESSCSAWVSLTLNTFRKEDHEYLTVIALLQDQHSSEKYPRSLERSVTWPWADLQRTHSVKRALFISLTHKRK